MKIEARQAEAFLKKPDPKIRGVVIYGNDDGLIAERALQLAKTVCEDLKDPFRVVDIAGETLKGDPARLADEFGALSLMGGRRVVRVRPAGEETATALENLVAAPAGDALIVIEGGNPVQLVRSLQRHADQLHLVSGHVAAGSNLEAAMFKARGLPRGGPVRQRFERHARAWPLPRLSAAVTRILEAEIDCKRTGLPDEAIARRLCLALAQAARQTRARR